MPPRRPRAPAPRAERPARRPIVPTSASADGGARATAIDPETHVVVAEFGRPHGVRGEIRVKSHTAEPMAVADFGTLWGRDGRAFTLSEWRLAPGGDGDMFVVRVDGIADRTAAEALTRLALHIPRASLPPLDDADEFYLADLVGLAVEDAGGRRLGRIVAVHDFGAGDVIEVAPEAVSGDPRSSSVMLPFTRAFVPDVDLAARRVVISADPFAPEPEPEPEPESQPRN